MTDQFQQLKQWIADMAVAIENNKDIDREQIASFSKEPKLSLALVDLIELLTDKEIEDDQSYYSACIFALDVCVAQLQSAQEMGNKLAGKILQQLMSYMALVISKGKHSLSFWLPILNAFYDVNVELSPQLRDAYLDLAEQEDEAPGDEQPNHLDAIRDMIAEMSDLSEFDIAENFFAQSHAMPADFFSDLVMDLYSIDEAQEIALLMLLHPRGEVREIVVATIEELINKITLSSISLSRLQVIRNWYPTIYHDQFNRWIKLQRMKGVVFHKEQHSADFHIKASEVDGSGAQGLFIHIKEDNNNRLCGLLFKRFIGIKDAWLTPSLSNDDIKRYYDDAFEDSVTLRDVDEHYLALLTNHFLAVTLNRGNVPDLHFLEIQELLGYHFQAKLLDIKAIIDELSVQIVPFTPQAMQKSFKRSNSWMRTKKFTESWYTENVGVDKLVNQYSSIINGDKICVLDEAVKAVIEQELEQDRDIWSFHFLWIALWVKAGVRNNEKVWQDSFLIAYAIYSDMPLMDIPLMRGIGRQTVLNSIETMNERRTHLS